MDLARAPSRLDDYLEIARDTRGFVMIADPFTSPMERVLNSFNEMCEGVPIIGGLASAANQPGENRLFLNDSVHADGLIGVGLGGPVQVDVIVSQGCRPIGPVFEVTNASNNIIDSLDGSPPMERISRCSKRWTSRKRSSCATGTTGRRQRGEAGQARQLPRVGPADREHGASHRPGTGRDAGKPCRTSASQKAHQHGLGLVVEGVRREQSLTGSQRRQERGVSHVARLALDRRARWNLDPDNLHSDSNCSRDGSGSLLQAIGRGEPVVGMNCPGSRPRWRIR